MKALRSVARVVSHNLPLLGWVQLTELFRLSTVPSSVFLCLVSLFHDTLSRKGGRACFSHHIRTFVSTLSVELDFKLNLCCSEKEVLDLTLLRDLEIWLFSKHVTMSLIKH